MNQSWSTHHGSLDSWDAVLPVYHMHVNPRYRFLAFNICVSTDFDYTVSDSDCSESHPHWSACAELTGRGPGRHLLVTYSNKSSSISDTSTKKCCT